MRRNGSQWGMRAPGEAHSQRPRGLSAQRAGLLSAERSQGPSGLVVDHRIQSQGRLRAGWTEDEGRPGVQRGSLGRLDGGFRPRAPGQLTLLSAEIAGAGISTPGVVGLKEAMQLGDCGEGASPPPALVSSPVERVPPEFLCQLLRDEVKREGRGQPSDAGPSAQGPLLSTQGHPSSVFVSCLTPGKLLKPYASVSSQAKRDSDSPTAQGGGAMG